MVVLSLIDPIEEYDIRDAFETLLEDSKYHRRGGQEQRRRRQSGEKQEEGISVEDFYTMYLGLGYCQPRLELDDLRAKVIQASSTKDGDDDNLIVTLDTAFSVLSQVSE